MLMLCMVLIAALLALASGVWVAVVLVRTLMETPDHVAGPVEKGPPTEL